MSTTPMESKDGASSSNETEPKTEIPPFRMATMEEICAQEVWNNCAIRSVASGVMGGGLGLFMGLFLGALDNPIMQDTMSGKEQFIYTAKQMGQRSWGHCKTFAVVGLIFSAAECTVEKVRAKHDMNNTMIAGCVTGGSLAIKGAHSKILEVHCLWHLRWILSPSILSGSSTSSWLLEIIQ